MKNIFDGEIKALDKEIKALKSFKQKVAQQIRTTKIIVPVELIVGSGFYSTKYAKITLSPYNNTIPLVSHTIDIQSLNGRQLWYVGGRQSNGDFVYEFYLTSKNDTDRQGDKLDYNLVFISTSQMDVQVEYEEY